MLIELGLMGCKFQQSSGADRVEIVFPFSTSTSLWCWFSLRGLRQRGFSLAGREHDSLEVLADLHVSTLKKLWHLVYGQLMSFTCHQVL